MPLRMSQGGPQTRHLLLLWNLLAGRSLATLGALRLLVQPFALPAVQQVMLWKLALVEVAHLAAAPVGMAVRTKFLVDLPLLAIQASLG